MSTPNVSDDDRPSPVGSTVLTHHDSDLHGWTEEIIGLYKDLVIYATKIVKNAHDAEDIVQEELWSLISSRFRTYDGARSLKNYLYKIIYHAAIEHLRKTKRTKVLSLDMSSDEGGISEIITAREYGNTEAEVEVLVWNERLQKAVERLSETDRELFELMYIHDMSPEQIAGMLGCNYGALRVRIFRMRQQLRKFFGREGGLQ